MAEVSVYNMSGEKVGTMNVSDAVFGVEVNEHLLHLAVTQQLANNRQGTQSAKTRAEVSGGGKKPWKQKGTGHARQGSTRSPQWRHGGIVFAPKPRDYSFKLNRKEKRLALKSALTSVCAAEKFLVIDEIKMDEYKTKTLSTMLKKLNAEKALMVVEANDDKIKNSAKNLPEVKTALVGTLNTYDVLKYGTVVASKAAVAQIEEVYA